MRVNFEHGILHVEWEGEHPGNWGGGNVEQVLLTAGVLQRAGMRSTSSQWTWQPVVILGGCALANFF